MIFFLDSLVMVIFVPKNLKIERMLFTFFFASFYSSGLLNAAKKVFVLLTSFLFVK